MSQHSPGPWKIGGEYSNNQDEIEAANGRAVAVVWTRKAASGATARSQFKEVPELMANMRLMTAAPELLMAIEDLRKELRAHIKLDVKKHYSLLVVDAAAGTAIAKATGGA